MVVTPEECLSVLARDALLPPSRVAVYLAGSLIRGWGKVRSDLDVYVVVPSPWPGRRDGSGGSLPVSVAPGSVPVDTVDVDGRRWDVEYWVDSQVDELLDAVPWESFESGRRTAASLTSYEVALMQRLAFSLPVEGAEWVERRAAEFESSAVKTMIAANALYELDLLTEDAVGMLADGDAESAVLAARQAFGHVVEILLASHGEFNRQPKWRARRMRSVAPPELGFDEYWALETMRGLHPEEPGGWVEDVLGVCQRVVADIRL